LKINQRIENYGKCREQYWTTPGDTSGSSEVENKVCVSGRLQTSDNEHSKEIKSKIARATGVMAESSGIASTLVSKQTLALSECAW